MSVPIEKRPIMMDAESRQQRQVESLEAIEERLEYLADVLIWIGEFVEDRTGHRSIDAGSPKRPPTPPWKKGADAS